MKLHSIRYVALFGWLILYCVCVLLGCRLNSCLHCSCGGSWCRTCAGLYRTWLKSFTLVLSRTSEVCRAWRLSE